MADWSAFPIADQEKKDPWSAFPMAQASGPIASNEQQAAPAEQPARPWMDRAKDFTEVAADSMSFGMLPRLAAKFKELRGVGTYDENLAANRKAVDDASARLGTAGSIGANVAGGVLTGSALGNAGITVLGRVPANAGMLAKIGAGALEGAAYGAANEAGHSQAQDWSGVGLDAAKGAGIGAAVGGAASGVMAALPRLITPNIADNPERTRLANVLREAGVDVSAGQATGSRNLATMEDAGRKLPLGRMISATNPEDQMGQFTRAVMDRSRVRGEAATFDAVNQAERQVGQTIGNVQRRYPIQQDTQYLTDLQNIANDIPLLPDGVQNQVTAFINRMVPNGQTIDPRVAQSLRTQLRLATPTPGPNTNSDVVRVFGALRDTLDNALERTIQNTGNPAHFDVLQRARQHYANINVLRDALSRSGPEGQLGYLTPAALKNAQSASLGKTSYMRGQGDLSELAQASAGVLPVKPGSQTAERSSLMNPLAWAASLPFNMAVNSRPAQAYLGNQVLPYRVTAPPSAVEGLLAPIQNRRRQLVE